MVSSGIWQTGPWKNLPQKTVVPINDRGNILKLAAFVYCK